MVTNQEQPSVVFDDGGQERVLFTLPQTLRPDLRSVLIFAMPKAGSVLLDGIMRQLSSHVGLTYVSIMQEFFTIGLPDASMPAETSKIFLPTGYCYGGFRYFPQKFKIPILEESQSILLVRDPRDMIVSHYFSMRNSHPEPGKALKSVNVSMSMRDLARALDIDEYAKHVAETFRMFLANYRTILCADCDAKVYRYEDVIYRKVNWVAELAEHFQWELPSDEIRSIAAQYDVIPDVEQETQHIRQVHPGNFRTKLLPETILWLENYFKEDMDFFGYNNERSNPRESQGL